MDPLTGNVTKYYNFNDPAFLGAAGKCGPTGVAASNIGGGTQLTIACGATGTQSLIFDPSANGGAGKILAQFTQVSGGDEVWFDPTTGLSFLTGLDPSGTNRLLGVVDLNNLAQHCVDPNPSDRSRGPFSCVRPDFKRVLCTRWRLHSRERLRWLGHIPGQRGRVWPRDRQQRNNGCILVFGQLAAVPEAR
jgi:hypothetical protein